ncbi:hypothetical protein AAY473_027197 [Plecturocebus cupreus]
MGIEAVKSYTMPAPAAAAAIFGSALLQSQMKARTARTKTEFIHLGQAGLKLLTSGDLPTSGSQSAGITCHFGKPRQVDHLTSGVRDQPGQYINRLGAVAHACNPSTLEDQGQEFKTSLANMAKPCLY